MENKVEALASSSAAVHYKDAVFYIPGENGSTPEIVDFASMHDGVLLGNWRRICIEDFRKLPGKERIQIGEYEDVELLKEQCLKTIPTEINEEAWDYALNVLPPMGWVRSASQSFKMSEHPSGRITAIYFAYRGRYFTFNDVSTLTHQEIETKVFETFRF